MKMHNMNAKKKCVSSFVILLQTDCNSDGSSNARNGRKLKVRAVRGRASVMFCLHLVDRQIDLHLGSGPLSPDAPGP